MIASNREVPCVHDRLEFRYGIFRNARRLERVLVDRQFDFDTVCCARQDHTTGSRLFRTGRQEQTGLIMIPQEGPVFFRQSVYFPQISSVVKIDNKEAQESSFPPTESSKKRSGSTTKGRTGQSVSDDSQLDVNVVPGGV